MKINQCALYRVNPASDGKALWRKSFSYAKDHQISVVKSNYKQKTISIYPLEEKDTAIGIRRKYQDVIEISDVLVFNRSGVLTIYYVDPDKLIMLEAFLPSGSAGTVITMDTQNYQIANYNGTWNAIDFIIVDGKHYYLMEHAKFGKNAQGVTLDEYGKLIVENVQNLFDDSAIQKIREASNVTAKLFAAQYQRLDQWQKYYQNGEWVRARESGTEANYNMIDGQVNNQNPTKDKKKRPSVLKKLRKKQIEIAKRSGKPIPKYLEQNRELKP